ncbi:MAG TPA: cupin domain-containing protein [Actinomycetota bacterium]|nr:cupin domain-containing protein [Actinomycetota bacterium]
MRRRMFVLLGLGAALGLFAGSALATPVINATAETARGPLVDRPLAVNWKFAPGNRVKLQTKGPMEIAFQRIVLQPATPGQPFPTLGWHSHPGPTVVTVRAGTLSFYHDEACNTETEYATGQSFSNLPNEIHLARNEGAQEVVLFAVYFVPVSSPPLALRIDQPSPGPGCPQ